MPEETGEKLGEIWGTVWRIEGNMKEIASKSISEPLSFTGH